jgi:hypothetical protein
MMSEGVCIPGVMEAHPDENGLSLLGTRGMHFIGIQEAKGRCNSGMFWIDILKRSWLSELHGFDSHPIESS